MTLIHYCNSCSTKHAVAADAVRVNAHKIYDATGASLVATHTDIKSLDKPDETSLDLAYLDTTYSSEY